MEWDIIYEDLKIWNWIILLLLSLLSYFLLSPARTLGTIVGGFLIIANFHILQHTLRKAFGNEKILRIKRTSVIFKFFFRILAMGLIMAVLVLKEWIDPFGLAIGLSTVVLAITLFGIKTALKIKSEETS